jgi:hypothetical protein
LNLVVFFFSNFFSFFFSLSINATDPENGQEGSEAHLAHFFIDTQHFVATGAAGDLTAAAIFLADPANFENLKSTLSASRTTNNGTSLHPAFEVHALRMLIKQTLSLVHSCGAALRAVPDKRSTLNTRAVVLRHSMSDAAIVALQLWSLDSGSNCTSEYVLEWCYGLADALASAGALTERHGALPAVVLPHLKHALSTAESILESNENQIYSPVVPSKNKKKATSAAATTNQQPQLLTDEEIEELKDVVESLKCGVDNCLLWLYGVRLPGVDEEEWGGSVVISNTSGAGETPQNAVVTAAGGGGGGGAGNANVPANANANASDTSSSIYIPPGGLRPLASQEAALVMWPSVSNHLVGQSVSALQKHKGFLENMSNLFPSLPDAIVTKIEAAFDDMASQEPPELDESLFKKKKKEIKNPMDGILETALQEGENSSSSSDAASWTKYLPIYKTLFHLLSLIQPSTPSLIDQASFPESLGILDPGADQILSTKIFAPLLADLAMNPREYPERWSSLALLYHEVADLILIKAAHEVPTRQWLYRTDLHRRVKVYRRLGHWCTAIDALCISESVENEEEKAELLELSGSKHYDEVDDVPPQYNQLDIRPLRNDSVRIQVTECALRAYQSAEKILPDEWAFKMHIGRCYRRLGKAPKEYLPLFARACQLAIVHHNGGLVDPVYTLHNARLKLVQQAQKELSLTTTSEVLYWVGKFCFLKETQDKLKEICYGFFDTPENAVFNLSEEQITSCCAALITDCVAALEWCLEKQKSYHRAALGLAKFYAGNGDSEQVIKYLAPLFSKYKATFNLNMSPIVATTTGGGRSSSSKQKRRAAAGGGGGGGGADKTPATESINAADASNPASSLAPNNEQIDSLGLCPTAKNIGIGVLESEVVFISRVRKALYLYFTALIQTNTRDILAAADAFFENIKLTRDTAPSPLTLWMSKPGFEDIRKLAKGCHVLCLLSSAFEICPLVKFTLPPETEEERREQSQQPRSRQPSPGLSPSKQAAIRAQARTLGRQHRHLRALAGQLDPTTAEPVLQEVYKLWSEHTGIVVSSVGLDNTTTPGVGSSGIGGGGNILSGYSASGIMMDWEPSVASPARFALSFLTGNPTTPAIEGGTTLETTDQTVSPLPLVSVPLPHAESLVAVLQGPGNQTVVQTYAQLYIHLLAVHGGSEKIKSMMVPLKRRFRKIKLCGEEPRKLIVQLCSAGVGALVAETKEVMASAAALAPSLAQPAEPLRDLVAENAAAAAAGGSGSGVALQSPVAPSPSSRPHLPPPPQVPAAAMIPTTLNQAQMQIIQNTALHQCQHHIMGVIQENAARGINLPPSVVQFMQERRFNQEVAELQRQAFAELNRTRTIAQNQYNEAMRQYTFQIKMIEQAHQRALSGLTATAPTTPAEQAVQDRIVQAMQQVLLYCRAAPWLNDDDTLPSLKSAKTAADDLRFELLRCYLVLGHINLPTTRQQAYKLCDEVMKLHKKGTMGGGGAGGSRPPSAPIAPPVFRAPLQQAPQQVPHVQQPRPPINTSTAMATNTGAGPSTAQGQGEPSPKRQRITDVINLLD